MSRLEKLIKSYRAPSYDVDVEALTAPFEPEEIKWRVEKPLKDNKYKVIPYFDSRSVFHRLNTVAYDNWNFEIKNKELIDIKHVDSNSRLLGVTWVIHSSLTIGYVTRDDVGTSVVYTRQKNGLTDDFTDKYLAEGAQLDAKTAVSDSVKRAAMQFGIGMYLWKFDIPVIVEAPNAWANFNEIVQKTQPRAMKRLEELGLEYQIKNTNRFKVNYDDVVLLLEEIAKDNERLDKTIKFLNKQREDGLQALVESLRNEAEY